MRRTLTTLGSMVLVAFVIATGATILNAFPQSPSGQSGAMGILSTVTASIAALADPGASGILVRTSTDTTVSRTLTAGSGITVTNGTGVSGNPTVALTNTPITDPASNGLMARTGTGTATIRTITGGNGITVSNGSGASGDPTLSLTNTVGGRSLTCASGVCDADAELYTRTCSFAVENPTVAVSALAAQCSIPTAATITRFYCITTAGQVDVNISERSEGTPLSGGSNVLTAAQTCTTTSTTPVTASFNDSAMAAHAILVPTFASPSGMAVGDFVWITVTYTVDD